MVATGREDGGTTLGAAALPEKPRLRGVLHLWGAVAAVPVGVWLALRAAPGLPRAAIAGYAAATFAMLAASALYHRRPWSEDGRRVMAGLDRCTIFIGFMAGASVWALQPGPSWARYVLVAAWAGVFVGVLAQIPRMATGWVPPPWCRAHWLLVVPYFALGVPIAVAAPILAVSASPGAGVLVAAGAVALTAGALAYAARRPNPIPRLFGYHEIFHAGVVTALALNTAALAIYMLPHP